MEVTNWLSNLLKAGFVRGGQEPRVIDYNEQIREKLKEICISLQNGDESVANGEFVVGLQAEVVEELMTPEEELAKAQEESEKIRQMAQEEYARTKSQIHQMLENAKVEAESLKASAIQQGKAEGYQDGLTQAQQEIDALKDSIMQERKELEEDYEAKMREIEPKLVDTILEVFERVTHILSETKRDVVLYLVEDALWKNDSSKHFLIRVSKDDYSFVAARKDLLQDKVPASSGIEIVRDSTLVRNQCFIETDGGIFDCSLDVQLESLISDIRLLSSNDY